MKKRDAIILKSVLMSLVLILLLVPVSAISIDIKMKSSFTAGERVYFDYTLLSSSNQDISYVAAAKCPDAPNPMLIIRNATLTANVPFSDSYIYLSNLTDIANSQQCTAAVDILSPSEEAKSVSFSIITNPGFDFSVNLCKDSMCTVFSKVFILGNRIYFGYNSSAATLQISAVLVLPDSSTREISVPGSVTADQTGTYTLMVNASKTGYRSISKQVEFGVIQKEANIGYTTPAAISQENSNINNPPSSSSQENSFIFSGVFPLILVGILVLIAIAVLVAYRIIKKKEKE